jgi:hypothetical protein
MSTLDLYDWGTPLSRGVRDSAGPDHRRDERLFQQRRRRCACAAARTAQPRRDAPIEIESMMEVGRRQRQPAARGPPNLWGYPPRFCAEGDGATRDEDDAYGDGDRARRSESHHPRLSSKYSFGKATRPPPVSPRPLLGLLGSWDVTPTDNITTMAGGRRGRRTGLRLCSGPSLLDHP